MKKLLVGFLMASLASLYGCSGDSNNLSSVTNPNPNPFTPKGTVSGLLRDAVTNVPLVNAKISISDRWAYTNEAGLFTIYNVPALNGAGNEPNNTNPPYPVVIDMTPVNNDIKRYNDNANNTVKKAYYPSTAYTNVDVVYSSLGETNQATGNTNATNHDTPADGFVANITPYVGKLDANIKIQVVNTSLVPVTSGTVQLYLSTTSNNDSSGIPEHLISTQQIGADGFVTFANVEARQGFIAKAFSSDGTLEGWYGLYTISSGNPVPSGQHNPATIIAPTDGLTDVYAVQGGVTTNGGTLYNNAIVLATVDNVAPFIISTVPGNLADIAVPAAPATTLDVVFNFSEPIRSSNYSNALTRETAVNGGLYNDVNVSYLGPKAGNIPYALAWSADRKQLIVSLALTDVTASSRYSVSIVNALNSTTKLTDDAKNAITSTTNSTVAFTTAGNFNVAAPIIAKTNQNNSLAIEWANVSNAASYKVYVAITGVTTYANLGTAVNGTTVFSVSTVFPTFNMTSIPGFSLANGREYTVKVTAVNGGGSESVYSNEVKFSETPPAAVTGIAKSAKPADVTSYTYTWNAVAGAVSYNVYVEPVVGGVGSGYDPTPVNVPVPTVDLQGKVTAVAAAMVAPVGPFDSNFTKGQQAIVWNVRITAVAPLGAESAPAIAGTQIVDQTRATGAAATNVVLTGVDVRPVAAAVAGNTPATAAAVTGTGSLTVIFDKTMNYGDLNTVSNWTISAPAGSTGTTFSVVAVTPNANGQSATVAYAYAIAPAAVANSMAVGNAPVSFLGKTVTALGVSNNPF